MVLMRGLFYLALMAGVSRAFAATDELSCHTKFGHATLFALPSAGIVGVSVNNFRKSYMSADAVREMGVARAQLLYPGYYEGQLLKTINPESAPGTRSFAMAMIEPRPNHKFDYVLFSLASVTDIKTEVYETYSISHFGATVVAEDPLGPSGEFLPKARMKCTYRLFD